MFNRNIVILILVIILLFICCYNYNYNETFDTQLQASVFTTKGEPGDQGVQGIPGIQGIKGADGEPGPPGRGVNSFVREGNDLIVNYTDGSSKNLGNIRGMKGDRGDDGSDGISVTTQSDGTEVEVRAGPKGEPGKRGLRGETGPIGPKGNQGTPGPKGRGVKSLVKEGDDLIVTYTDGESVNLGNIKGEKGEDGAAGAAGAVSSGGSGEPNIFNNNLKQGMIIAWKGSIENIPDGWELCDGNNGTPDLRGRFILGANPVDNKNELSERTIGTKGGAQEVALTTEQMPRHKHLLFKQTHVGQGQGNADPGNLSGFSVSEGANALIGSFWNGGDNDINNYGFAAINRPDTDPTHGKTSRTGNGDAHNNMPPYYVLAYIMKVKDDEVSEEYAKLKSAGSNPVILNQGFKKGMVLAWSGSIDQIPNGWSLCDGTNYTGGSDKKPDLRGRFILGHGQGFNLNNRNMDDIGGEENVTLNINQMPKHKHPEERAAPSSWGFHTLNSGSRDKSSVRAGAQINGSWHEGGSSTMPPHQHGDIGGDQPHNNMPPYYVLAYIVKETDDLLPNGYGNININPYTNMEEDGDKIKVKSGKELCIGQTCVTEDKLKEILSEQTAGAGSGAGSGSGAGAVSDADPDAGSDDDYYDYVNNDDDYDDYYDYFN